MFENTDVDGDPVDPSWENYKLWAREIAERHRTMWMFRGHRDSSWGLASTFARDNSREVSLHTYRWYVVGELAYYYCTLYGEVLDLNDGLQMASFLGQLQHHNFPTPLLDWTLSPYIAAYFALRDVPDRPPASGLCRVYAFDYRLWQENNVHPGSVWDMFGSSPMDPFIALLTPVPRNNPRIIPQQGRFTISNCLDLVPLIQEREKAHGRTYLKHRDIDVAEVDQALREIDMMGIREMQLFPDFDGLCRGLKKAVFPKDPKRAMPPSLGHVLERPIFSEEVLSQRFGPSKKRSD